jgi:aminoglycoside phosphotransferase (APT) family kinase protein
MLPPPAKGPLSNQVRQKIYDILGDLCCDLAIPCNVHFPFKDERATVLFKALTAAAVYADRYAKAKLAAIENAKAVGDALAERDKAAVARLAGEKRRSAEGFSPGNKRVTKKAT